MNNKKRRNRLFTLLLVMAILMPYGGDCLKTHSSQNVS